MKPKNQLPCERACWMRGGAYCQTCPVGVVTDYEPQPTGDNQWHPEPEPNATEAAASARRASGTSCCAERCRLASRSRPQASLLPIEQ